MSYYRPLGTQIPLHDLPCDERPAHGAWSPGYYLCHCILCDQFFMGDKRATRCAYCAYKTCPDPAPNKPTS